MIVHRPQNSFDPLPFFRLILSRCLTITLSCVFLGCTERPTVQVDAVWKALQAARLAGAQEYAIESLTEAELFYRQAIDALDRQDAFLFPLRSYDRAADLLAASHSWAEVARIEALSNQRESEANARLALDFARQQIHQLRQLGQRAFQTGITHPLLNEWRLGVYEGERMVQDIEHLIRLGDFIKAMTVAHKVEELLGRIHERFNQNIKGSGVFFHFSPPVQTSPEVLNNFPEGKQSGVFG